MSGKNRLTFKSLTHGLGNSDQRKPHRAIPNKPTGKRTTVAREPAPKLRSFAHLANAASTHSIEPRGDGAVAREIDRNWGESFAKAVRPGPTTR